MSAGVIAAHYAAAAGGGGDLLAALLAPGPVGVWLLDDDATGLPKNAIQSKSGSAATLALPSGVTKVADAPAGAGTGFHLANISQQLNAANLGGGGTAHAFVMVMRTSDPQGCLFGSREFGGQTLTAWIGPTGKGFGTNGHLSLGWHGDGGLYQGVETTTAVLNDGNWHTVVCMTHGTNGAASTTGDFSIWIDGTQVATTSRQISGSITWPYARTMCRFASNYDWSGADLSVDFAAIAAYMDVVLTGAQIGNIHAAAMGA